MEGGWLFSGLKKEERSALVGKTALVYGDFEFIEYASAMSISPPCFPPQTLAASRTITSLT